MKTVTVISEKREVVEETTYRSDDSDVTIQRINGERIYYGSFTWYGGESEEDGVRQYPAKEVKNESK